MQDNTQMNCPTPKDVLIALCRRRPELLHASGEKEGEINHNEVARITGVHQPTITRILLGNSAEPKRGNMEKIARAFGVTVEQAYGRQKIEGLFPNDEHSYPVTGNTPSPRGEETAAPAVNEDIATYLALTDEKQLAAVIATADLVSPRDAIVIAEYFLSRAKAGLPEH